MEKAFKILLILIAAWVALVVLYFVFSSISNVLGVIQENITVILVIVAVLSGLTLLITDNDSDSGIRTIAGLLLITSIISIIGSFIGNLMEQGIGSFFK